MECQVEKGKRCFFRWHLLFVDDRPANVGSGCFGQKVAREVLLLLFLFVAVVPIVFFV